jgi:hypothetical protein
VRKIAGGLAAGLSSLLLISGCAEGSASRGPDVELPSIPSDPMAPTSYLAGVASLPWRDYVQSPAQAAAGQQAKFAVTVTCMHRRGYSDFRKSLIQYASPDFSYEPGGPYGWIDKRKAARYGFHSSPADYATVHMSAAHISTVENARLEACLSQAAEELDGGKASDPRNLANQLFETSWNLATRDPRVRAATERWAKCMHRHGLNLLSPPEAANWAGKTPNASPREIVIATADADCTESSGLAGVFFAVDAGYQRELIRANASALASVAAGISAENRRDAAELDR